MSGMAGLRPRHGTMYLCEVGSSDNRIDRLGGGQSKGWEGMNKQANEYKKVV